MVLDLPDIAISPIDRIMRKAGAERVSEEGAESPRGYGVARAGHLQGVYSPAKHAGRKTVNAEDVKMASRKLIALTKLGV